MQHQSILTALKAFGYANLLFLLYALFSLKAYEGSLFLLIAPPIIALAGTVLYYLYWSRVFPGVDKKIARVIMRPYILGTAITILAMVLILTLGLYGSHRQANIGQAMPALPPFNCPSSTVWRYSKSQNPAPNWAFKRTPTLAMASPFSWPVLVPSALAGSGAA